MCFVTDKSKIRFKNTNIKYIIPKESLYLINEDGTEHVSTSIKILKH